MVGIKLLHMAIWGFFAGCILAIPVMGALAEFLWAMILTGAVLVECAVLVFNRGRCPLTDIAAPYTEDRRANFDIYLPEWLARYNKGIFETLFVWREPGVLAMWIHTGQM